MFSGIFRKKDGGEAVWEEGYGLRTLLICACGRTFP